MLQHQHQLHYMYFYVTINQTIYMITCDFPDYQTYVAVFCYGSFFMDMSFNMVGSLAGF